MSCLLKHLEWTECTSDSHTVGLFTFLPGHLLFSDGQKRRLGQTDGGPASKTEQGGETRSAIRRETLLPVHTKQEMSSLI